MSQSLDSSLPPQNRPAEGEVSPWLLRHANYLAPLKGRALDLACGSGRHSRYLHSRGFDVFALDRDPSAFAGLSELGVACIQADLEGSLQGSSWPFREQSFAVVVVTNYLHRPLFPMILRSLQVGGVLFYETFADGHQAFGRPRNPDFLLKRNELLQRCLFDPSLPEQFECLAFEHAHVNRNGPAIVQAICARRVSA